MKISLDSSFENPLSGLMITPKSACLNRAKLRTSASCRVNIKLPSVEIEEKTQKEVAKFPLRSISASGKRVRRQVAITGHLFEVDFKEKTPENKFVTKKVSFRFIRPAYEKFLDESVANVANIKANIVLPLPDPYILEHKRATLRLRKLKRVVKSNCKENILE
jgi:hypothetical protein